MKKSKMKNRLLFFSCVLSGMMLGGCTDGDYKISSVDATFGVGNGNLKLPSNSSFVITLDDILDLGNTDLVTVDENTGDYMFGKDPETITDVNVKIKEISSENASQPLSFPGLTLPAAIQALAGQTVKPADYGVKLDIAGNISLMDYTFTAPNEVKKLNYVELGDGAALKIDISVPGVTRLAKLEITLPQQLVVTNQSGGSFEPSTNKLTLTNYSVSAGKLTLNFLVTRINTELNTDNTFTLKGNVHMYVDVAELAVPNPCPSALNFSGAVTTATINVSAANGQFKPTIDAQQVGTTTINSLPAFLTDKRVVADVDNPQIWLTLQSNMPLGGYVEAKLSSTTSTEDVILSKAKGNQLPIAANGTTRLVICRKAPSGLSGYTPVIAPDLSKLIMKLEEGMKIDIDVTKFEAEQTSDVTVKLGYDYTFTPSYRFKAPLALGDQAEVVYKETEDDWNKDLKDFQLTSASKVFLTASVNNGVPADLEVNIKPLDVKGAGLAGLIVKPIKNKVLAGETAGVIQYEITDPHGAGLKDLNGVEYELLVVAPSSATDKGKALNKNQKITIKTTDLQLNGKVIIDAN
jgi:hypothetical protein